jgi:hypothetical protein
MTEVLFGCLILTSFLVAGTLALMVLPVRPGELRLWGVLQTRVLRRWITRRRNVNQPLHGVRTLVIAKTNLWWHLILTALFFGLIARAALDESCWWRPLAVVMAIPAVAYFLGSLMQRQKIAIIELRQGRPDGKRGRADRPGTRPSTMAEV